MYGSVPKYGIQSGTDIWIYGVYLDYEPYDYLTATAQVKEIGLPLNIISRFVISTPAKWIGVTCVDIIYYIATGKKKTSYYNITFRNYATYMGFSQYFKHNKENS